MKFSIKDFFGKLNKSAVSCGFDHISLRKKYPNKEFFLVSVFPHLDWERRDTEYSVRMRENMNQKKLRIWTFFT